MNERRKESNHKVIETVLSEKHFHHKFLLSGSNGKLEFNDEVKPEADDVIKLFGYKDADTFMQYWEIMFNYDDADDDDIYNEWYDFISMLDDHDIAIFLVQIKEDEYDPFRPDSEVRSYSIGEWTELVKTENDWRLYRLLDGLETEFIELDEDEIVKMYNAVMTERAAAVAANNNAKIVDLDDCKTHGTTKVSKKFSNSLLKIWNTFNG
jgi:hypothetical protein